MTKQTWQNIYVSGEQLNKYPYDFIVSSFFRYRPVKDEPIKVLDLGCGAGNNALFFAENNAEVFAVDYSNAALEVLQKRAVEKGLEDRVRVQQVDFEDFTLNESGFDIVVDRLAVSHVGRQYAISVYNRVYEVMNTNGIVLSNVFTTGHTHKNYGKYDKENEIWSDFTGGIFEHLKTACFYTEEEIRDLFNKFSMQSLSRETEYNLPIASEASIKEQLEIWKIIARKDQ